MNDRRFVNLRIFALIFCFGFAFSISVNGQRLAIIAPDGSSTSRKFAADIADTLSETNDVLDSSLCESAFRAVSPNAPFNMTINESKVAGTAIGSDFIIIVKSDTIRRSSFSKPEYYESFAAVYTVSSKTGQLVDWSLPKFEAPTPSGASKLLNNSINEIGNHISAKLRLVMASELPSAPKSAIEELPPENSPEGKDFQAPIPFRRIKPEYTSTAFMFDVTATVELELDLDANGKILRTEIVRWAGYGLDESVEQAVRSMNWRPAMRGGKPLPMRVLLRYNFKKVDK